MNDVDRINDAETKQGANAGDRENDWVGAAGKSITTEVTGEHRVELGLRVPVIVNSGVA
jgi:hypothetical protein